VKTTFKNADELRVGDSIVLTPKTFWHVVSVRPYEGPLQDLKGGFIAYSDHGAITVGPGEKVEVLA
jgi:hypothetical protein